MNRRCLSLFFGLLFVVLLAPWILTTQSDAQAAIFYPPSEGAPKKKGAKSVPPNPATGRSIKSPVG